MVCMGDVNRRLKYSFIGLYAENGRRNCEIYFDAFQNIYINDAFGNLTRLSRGEK